MTSHEEQQNHRLSSLSKTFFIRPKATGLVSLFIQAVVLIVSATTTMFFFYHVGGYEYTHWNENSTILEPINHNIHKPVAISEGTSSEEWLVSTRDRDLDFLDELNRTNIDVQRNGSQSSVVRHNEMIENASFGIEQVPTTTVYIGGIEFDWLEVIRISTLIMICIDAIWVLSGILFICTVRCELLDPVIFNTNVLILVLLLFCAHSGLIASLIFFQREMSWRTMSITIGSLVIIICCAFLEGICIALNLAWVRYVTYMRGNQNCIITALCCCSNKKSIRSSNHERRGNTQHDNDVHLERFDAF